MSENICKNKIGTKTVLLLCALSLVFFLLSLIAGGLIPTIFAGACLGAAFFLSSSNLPLVVAPIAYLAWFILSEDPTTSLPSLAFVAVAAIIAHSLSKKISFVGIVCRISAVSVAIEAIVIALGIYDAYASIDAQTVRTAISDFHLLYTDMMYDIFSAAPYGTALPQSDISLLSAFYIGIFPGLLIVTCNITSCLTVLATFWVCRIVKCKDAILDSSKAFKMSRMSAVVFFLSYLFFILFSGEDLLSAVPIVTINLLCIFTPALALYGFKDFLKRTANRRPGFRVFSIILIIIFPLISIGMLAFFGALTALRALPQKNQVN